MPIFTYLKLALAGALVAICLYLVWNYQHLKAENARKDQIIATQKAENAILTKQLKEAQTFENQKPAIKKEYIYVPVKEQQQVLESGDMDAIYKLFEPYSSLRDSTQPPAKSGGKRSPAPNPGS
jgi:hypothetical protein